MEIATAIEEIKLHNGEEILRLRLPEEIIIEEILPKLQVKSLLKFRCVSKSWCSLISSKKFMKLHLRNSIKSSSLAHHRILFNTMSGSKHCSLPSLFNESLTDAINDNADFGIDYEKHIVGCCNGLVCILINRKRFILWNPSTKKSNHLPNFDDEIMRGSIRKYGFGLDELNDDYKVFGVLSVFYKNGVYIHICKVYSLRSNSWEVIEGRVASSFEEGGIYVSGKLHWDTDERGKIVSFDLNSKVYGVVELPSYLKDGKIEVLKGCLSVYCLNQESHVDIWVMNEYEVNESWNKVATVPYYNNFLPRPLTIGPNGDVLVKYGIDSNLLIYDPKGKAFRQPRITDDATLIFADVGIYIESLAYVDPDAQQEN